MPTPNEPEIRIYDHGAPGFWELLGPHFASRDVHRELGYPVFSDHRTRWLVAVHRRQAVAWLGLRVDPERVDIEWAWVAPEWRRRGLYREMEREALRMARGHVIRRATCLPWMAERWRAQGFHERSRRGSWIYMEREARDEA